MRHAYCANLHAFASPLAVLFMRVHKRPDILLLLRGILCAPYGYCTRDCYVVTRVDREEHLFWCNEETIVTTKKRPQLYCYELQK